MRSRRSESSISFKIVGKALAEGGRRAGVVLATKVGLDWKNKTPQMETFRIPGTKLALPRPPVGTNAGRYAISSKRSSLERS